MTFCRSWELCRRNGHPRRRAVHHTKTLQQKVARLGNLVARVDTVTLDGCA
jgi:hypothetical protein